MSKKNDSIVNLDGDEHKKLEKVKRISKGFTVCEGGELISTSGTYVGCGINVITASGPSFIEGYLLDDKKRAEEIFDVIPLNEGFASSLESDDFLETFTKLKIETEVRKGEAIPFFSGGLSSKYGESRKVSTTAKFFSSIVEIRTRKQGLKSMYSNPERMKTLLHPYVLEDINNDEISPLELFDIYGTHMTQLVSIGGSVQVTAVYNSSEKLETHDFKIAMDAACSYVSVKASTELTSEQKKLVNKADKYARSFGGKPNVLAGQLKDITQMMSLLKLWGESIGDTDNQVLTGIQKYVPLWKFADTEKRREELEDGFYELAKQQGVNVSEYISKTLPAKLVGLSSRNALSGRDINSFVARTPDQVSRTEKAKGAASFAGINANDPICKLRMIENDDETVSFQHCESGGYLKAETHSFDSNTRHQDVGQLYFTGTSITEREKFKLERISEGGNKYKLKIRIPGKNEYYYIYTYHDIGSRPTLCADKSKGITLVEFEITEI